MVKTPLGKQVYQQAVIDWKVETESVPGTIS